MQATVEDENSDLDREIGHARATIQRAQMRERRQHREQREREAAETDSMEMQRLENERYWSQQDYDLQLATEASLQQQRLDHGQFALSRRRESQASHPVNAMLPLVFTYRWFSIRTRRFWQNATPGVRVLSPLLAISLLYIFLSYTFQLLLGCFFYTYAYYLAYNGFEYMIDGCYTAKLLKQSFWNWDQTHREWLRLKRCEGYEDAAGREDGLSPATQVLERLIRDPFGSSPGIYLTTLALIVYFVLPHVGRKIRSWSISLWREVKPSLCNISWGNILWGKIVFICLIGYFALLLAGNKLFPKSSIKVAIILGVGILLITSFLILKSKPRTMQRRESININVCLHTEPCFCYDEKDHRITALGNDNTDLLLRLRIAEDDLASQKQLVDAANRNLRNGTDRMNEQDNRGPRSPSQWQHAGLGDPRSQHWQNMFVVRDGEFARLSNEKEEQDRQYRSELDRLRKDVNYTTGISLDTETANNKLREANATIRNLERQNNALSMSGMALRHELAKEKESHSEKCQNEAGCQRRIRELEENIDRIIAHVKEDQYLVTDACIKLGMDAKEAEHIQLRAYLAEVTIKLAQLYTMGVPGADTTDLQVDIMRKEVARETKYKNRLERELERLGGNVLDVRMGLDTTRPQDWKTVFMTYEENHLRVFPIYLSLWQAIVDMTDIFAREGFVLPIWYEESVRTDTATNYLALQPAEAVIQLAKASEDMKVHSFESLIEKIVISEFQRLYNRGLQLLSFLDSNMTIHANIAGISGVNTILNKALHQVLDLTPAILLDHSTERKLSPRKQHKFKIYSAMQDTITSLSILILANKRHPPPWLSTTNLNTLFSKPYSTPENLTANLSNHELSVLATRIHQLMTFTETYSLPGTKSGPPLVHNQHDPDYNARWTRLVIARTFAELTISHWNVHKSQKEVLITDPQGRQLITFQPNPSLLPLDIEKFREAAGLKPLEREDRRWPDDWKAKMITDPSSGPALVFAPNPTGPKSDDNKPKDPERTKLINDWKEQSERCQQLYNHVIGYGLKGSLPRLETSTLRANADAKVIRTDVKRFQELQNLYTSTLANGGQGIPPWRKRGGKMSP